MSNINVANIVNAWAEEKLGLPFTIYNDMIPDEDADGACLRHDPAPAAEKKFCDGSRLITWNLTYYVRCENAEDARNYAKNITDKLDGQTITDSDTGTEIDCEASTLPQFIEVDAKNYTTYSAAIKCKYLQAASEE